MKKIIKILIVSIVVVVLLVTSTFGVSADTSRFTLYADDTLSIDYNSCIVNFESATFFSTYIASSLSKFSGENLDTYFPNGISLRGNYYQDYNPNSPALGFAYGTAGFLMLDLAFNNTPEYYTGSFDFYGHRSMDLQSTNVTGDLSVLVHYVDNTYVSCKTKFGTNSYGFEYLRVEVPQNNYKKISYYSLCIPFTIYSVAEGSTYQLMTFDNFNFKKLLSDTDKILDGDEDLDSSGDTGKVSGSIDNVDDAKGNALGGKSDKEIQKEINSALDSDKIGLDFNKAGRISNFFDNLLNAFGSGYKTLLMLSLSLGLAGFLIGRRWA